jgi:hypothetical protein
MGTVRFARGCLAVSMAAFVAPAAVMAQTPAPPQGAAQVAPRAADPPKAPPPVALPRPQLPPGLVPAAPCPDPALRPLTYKVVERTPGRRFQGKVSLIATVENVGKGEYRSRPNQQQIQLFETPRGGQPRMVASREFGNLAPGQKVDLVWTRPWDASSPAEGEFAPSYEAKIVYDPDIRTDGNPANDECSAGNNAARLNGKSINEAMRAG